MHHADAWDGREPLRIALRILIVGAGLLTAAALAVPFLDLRVVGSGTEPYGLFKTVELLWTSGMRGLAVLVVGFSAILGYGHLSAPAVGHL
jgi:uncharacterized paraquat-inducible protein A